MTNGYRTHSDRTMPRGFWRTAFTGVKRYGFLGAASRYLLMLDQYRRFVRGGPTRDDRESRKKLLREFRTVQDKVACAHSPSQFVVMADYVLNLAVDGPMVECGCFKGGSAAKLSLLAKHTGRRLFVCDSFEGLPEPPSQRELTLTGHGSFSTVVFAPGEYRGTLSEVRDNVDRYGCVDVCEFVPGFFDESLRNLRIAPAFVFTDVDLVSSARDCLKYLWPRLVPGGLWFTHEAWSPDYITGILDAEWWHQTLGEYPPVIAGGLSGLSAIAETIAYFQKRTKKVALA